MKDSEAAFAAYALAMSKELVERVEQAGAALANVSEAIPHAVASAVRDAIKNEGGAAVETWLRRLDQAAAERLVAAVDRRWRLGVMYGGVLGFAVGAVVGVFIKP